MSTASDLANTLATSLLAGTDFTITLPSFNGNEFKIPEENLTDPLYAPVPKLSNADLTNGANSIAGSGSFDVLMQGFKAHLRAEYDANRISGAEYTKAYIACTEAAMANGTQFLISRDTAFWSALNAQYQAQRAKIEVVTARVQLESEKTKLQLLRIQALDAQVQYALNKLKLATEDITYNSANYNLTTMLPIQRELIQEQIEAQRAQTLDNRKDGTPVAGSVGKQKELYTQQITSYKRDAENKGVKVFTDAWITMKTIDEGLAPPTLFSNANLDAVLTTLKTNLSL